MCISEDADIEKYKEMAKTVCKIEHGFVLGHDIVKQAAKETAVETFDQVCTCFRLLNFMSKFHVDFHVGINYL